jgi:hypothetical protein
LAFYRNIYLGYQAIGDKLLGLSPLRDCVIWDPLT